MFNFLIGYSDIISLQMSRSQIGETGKVRFKRTEIEMEETAVFPRAHPVSSACFPRFPGKHSVYRVTLFTLETLLQDAIKTGTSFYYRIG